MAGRLDLDLGEARAVLERAGRLLTDTRPMMQDIGEYMIVSTRERFVAGVTPEGAAWAPNSPVTVARKGGARPLWGRSGRLRQNISYRAGPDLLVWGSPLVYAAVQQFGAARGAFGTNRRGSPIPWGKIPPRPFIGFSAQDRTNVAAIAQEWLERATGA